MILSKLKKSVNAPTKVFALVVGAFFGICTWTSALALTRTEDLTQVQKQIESLKNKIVAQEEDRDAASQALTKAEQLVQVSDRMLKELAAERRKLDKEIAITRAEQKALSVRILERERVLARWVHTYYTHGQESGLGAVLGEEGLNEWMRKSVYTQRLAQARLAQIQAQKQDQENLLKVQTTLNERLSALKKNEYAAQTEQKQRLKALESRRLAMRDLDNALEGEQKKVHRLEQNARRLSALIAGLENMQAKPVKQSKPAVEAKPIRDLTPKGDIHTPSKPAVLIDTPDQPLSPSQPEGDVLIQDKEPVPQTHPTDPVFLPKQVSVQFEKLKGMLPLPVSRARVSKEGERCINLHAPAGSAVGAVAPGTVVFADWLRGFGYLLIVDHGDQYLSVYGNNENLQLGVGDVVHTGQRIASVASSVEGGESVSYFEIRHQGKSLDTAKWLKIH